MPFANGQSIDVPIPPGTIPLARRERMPKWLLVATIVMTMSAVAALLEYWPWWTSEVFAFLLGVISMAAVWALTIVSRRVRRFFDDVVKPVLEDLRRGGSS